MLAAIPIGISSTTVRTSVDGEQLAMWCGLGIRQTWGTAPALSERLSLSVKWGKYCRSSKPLFRSVSFHYNADEML